jgi:hypothetical protein
MRALCLAALLAVAACAAAPSEDQCQKLRDHLIELQVKEGGGTALTDTQQKQVDDSTHRVKYMDTCTTRVTKQLVECALAAATIEEARACDEKK